MSARKHPVLLFGLPFVSLIVAGSFALEPLTRTRYDLHRHQEETKSKEDALKMNKDRRKLDLREEYFRLSAPGGKANLDNWEPVRVPRPAGTPEWGVPPPSPATSPADATSSPSPSASDKASESSRPA